MAGSFIFEPPGALAAGWREVALSAVTGELAADVRLLPLTEPLGQGLQPFMAPGDATPAAARPAADRGILASQWPLAMQAPSPGTPSVACLAPPAQLIQFALRDPNLPSWRTLRDAGLSCEFYQLLCSPGFDCLRLRTDAELSLPCPLTSYADACTVEEALASLDAFGLVLLGQGEQALEVMQLLMHFEQQPLPSDELPDGLHPDPSSWSDEVQALVSDFDRRFYAAAQARFTRTPDEIRQRYATYLANYPAQHGLALAPRTGRAWPLQGRIGPGWHQPEQTPQGRWFRWSAGPDATVRVPLASPGRYRFRAYVYPQGTGGVHALLGLADEPGVEMFSMDHEDLRLLEGELTLPAAQWCTLRFQHGEMPTRGGPDQRLRGFVFSGLLVRRLS